MSDGERVAGSAGASSNPERFLLNSSSTSVKSSAAALVLAAWLPVAGCSAVFLPSPSAPASPMDPVTCKTSSPLPVIDLVGGGVAIVTAGQVDNKNQRSTAAAALVWGGLLAVASGLWGNHKLSNCEELEMQQQQRRKREERLMVFAAPANSTPRPPAPDAPAQPAVNPSAADPWLAAGPPPEALGVNLLASSPDGGAADAGVPR
jgi:hypothetical protein